MINKTFSNVIVIGIYRNAVNTKIEPSYESSKNKMSTGGLEPPLQPLSAVILGQYHPVSETLYPIRNELQVHNKYIVLHWIDDS